jgi:hypothetical protein
MAMGQLKAIKKVKETRNHVHMLKTGNPMVGVTIYSKSIFSQVQIIVAI